MNLKTMDFLTRDISASCYGDTFYELMNGAQVSIKPFYERFYINIETL